MSVLRNSIKFGLNFQRNLINNTKTFNVLLVRNARRWVAPTFRELLHRRNKFKTPVFTARNTFPEWNYNAEIFAFGKRLNENFTTEHLQQAFIDSSYINQEEKRQKELGVETDLNIKDNRNLIQIGEKCISDYIQSYLQYSLPKCPQEGITKIFGWLTSEDMLANVSTHIGTKDLILCAGNEPTSRVLRDTFVAIIGALCLSSGEEKAYNFIRDLICTQLNQKDLTEIWVIEKPFEDLKNFCKNSNLTEPEPRLLGQNGINTVLAAHYVGIYSDKQLLGKGFGETTGIAIEAAALDALCKIYDIHPNKKNFNFEIEIEQNQQPSIQKKNSRAKLIL